MQARWLAGERRLEIDPDVVHALAHGFRIAPAAVARLEDPFALALVEGRTAAGQQGDQGSGGGDE
ncbi:hypothetical protein [Variovorax sp. J31P179]|uniref:hypothetical protein n=1 Tax=Variovorax sp. J31P179 TaxID=3053508 RepID=UPI00336594C5